MFRNYKFRIYPTKAQVSKLEFTLNQCRLLWNLALEQHILVWKTKKQKLSCYDQIKQLPELKQVFPDLRLVHSQVCQNTLERLDLAFKSFYRRLRRRETPGFPRFKPIDYNDSFCYPQSGFKISNNHIYLSKIGHVKLTQHREIPGRIKRCTVKRSPLGDWFVVLSVNVGDEPIFRVIPKSFVGIDVGIQSFLTTNSGDKVSNPRFFKNDSRALAKAQRKHSKVKNKKSKRVVQKIHKRIFNRRDNFTHQLSKQFVNDYDYIAIEDLNINRLKHNSNRNLNREINDVSWRSFSEKLIYKAANAGKTVVKVNPAYTSQDCSGCGYRVEKLLKNRVHTCPACSLTLDRDHNAAVNILALGLQCLAPPGSLEALPL